MEKFQIINYKSKQAVKIETEHLNELKKGKYCEFAEYLKLAPEEENLILEMLPEDVLLYIFQFLSPGDLIRVALTCQTLNELSQDTNTWRNISYNYNQFFIFDKVEVEKRTYFYQENQIPIYGIIEKTQLLSDDMRENASLINPKKLKKTKSTLTSLLRRRNQNEDENELDNLFNQNEIKIKLMEYIEKVPNPKEELISKANLIYNGIKQRKEQLEKNLKKREEDDKRWRKVRRIENFSFGNLIFLALGLVVFIITLNVYIEKKLSSHAVYVFIPILLPIFIYIIILFIWSIFESTFIFSMYGVLMIMLFIQLLLIGLRSDSTIKGSWLLIFLPFLIFFGIAFIGSFFLIFDTSHFECINTIPPTLIGLIFLFLIFLGLRLDDKITWNYGVVFIPLFLINLFPCWLCCSFCFDSGDGGYAGMAIVAFFFLFIIILLPLLIFEILLVLFLEVSSVNHITYPFILIYVVLGIALCWLCIVGFLQIFG